MMTLIEQIDALLLEAYPKKAKLVGWGRDKAIEVTIDGEKRTITGRDGETVFVHSKPDWMGLQSISLRRDSKKYLIHRSFLEESELLEQRRKMPSPKSGKRSPSFVGEGTWNMQTYENGKAVWPRSPSHEVKGREKKIGDLWKLVDKMVRKHDTRDVRKKTGEQLKHAKWDIELSRDRKEVRVVTQQEADYAEDGTPLHQMLVLSIERTYGKFSDWDLQELYDTATVNLTRRARTKWKDIGYQTKKDPYGGLPGRLKPRGPKKAFQDPTYHGAVD